MVDVVFRGDVRGGRLKLLAVLAKDLGPIEMMSDLSQMILRKFECIHGLISLLISSNLDSVFLSTIWNQDSKYKLSSGEKKDWNQSFSSLTQVKCLCFFLFFSGSGVDFCWGFFTQGI